MWLSNKIIDIVIYLHLSLYYIYVLILTDICHIMCVTIRSALRCIFPKFVVAISTLLRLGHMPKFKGTSRVKEVTFKIVYFWRYSPSMVLGIVRILQETVSVHLFGD